MLKIFSRKKYKPLSIKLVNSNSFYIFGFLGKLLFIFKKTTIIKKNETDFFFFHKNYKAFFKLFIVFFIGVSSGWFLKLEISGRGYFVYGLKNVGYFNLGFSHGVSYIFVHPIETLVFEKKKRLKFTLHGINLFNLYHLAIRLKKLRPLNIYKGKGIKFENEIIKLKQGKQGNF